MGGVNVNNPGCRRSIVRELRLIERKVVGIAPGHAGRQRKWAGVGNNPTSPRDGHLPWTLPTLSNPVTRRMKLASARPHISRSLEGERFVSRAFVTNLASLTDYGKCSAAMSRFLFSPFTNFEQNGRPSLTGMDFSIIAGTLTAHSGPAQESHFLISCRNCFSDIEGKGCAEDTCPFSKRIFARG